MRIFFRLSSVFQITALAVLFLVVFWSQTGYNHFFKDRRSHYPAQVFLAPATLVESSSFGFRNFLADVFWIQSVQYLIIEGLLKNSFMFQYLDIVTTLDPRFEYPYLFANLILPRKGSKDEARFLTDRGIEAIPSSWQIPFYLGVQYKVFSKDYEQALKYMNIAASKPGKPDYVDSLIASYTLRSGDQTSARELFDAIYKTTTNEFIKQSAKAWIQEIDHIGLIQSLVFGYKRLYGVYPQTIDDLITKKLIGKIPDDIKSFRFIINQETGMLTIE